MTIDHLKFCSCTYTHEQISKVEPIALNYHTTSHLLTIGAKSARNTALAKIIEKQTENSFTQ